MNPQPIDTNRLKAMLGGARKVMQRVESGDFETGNVDSSTLAMGDQLIEQAPVGAGGVNTSNVAPKVENGTAHYPNISKSKMPEAIKKAMMEQPIPQANMAQTFTLDEVLDYERDEKPVPPPNTPRTNPKQPIRENTQQPIDSSQIREIIREEMGTVIKEEILEFFSKYFAKALAEDTQKKLIQHLIKEGQLKIKKKK